MAGVACDHNDQHLDDGCADHDLDEHHDDHDLDEHDHDNDEHVCPAVHDVDVCADSGGANWGSLTFRGPGR